MRYKLNLLSIIAANMTFGAIAPALFASHVQQSVMIYVSSRSNLNGDASPNNPYSSIANIASTQAKNAPNTIESIEIIRSPDPVFNKPVNPPIALSPSSETVMLETLPDVPSPVSRTKPTSSNAPNPDKKIIAQNSSQEDISNARIAALVPPPAIDKVPYLVVIPSSDSNVLNQVRSIISTAKFIPSRFGYMIMVQGYPDRDRAEILKTIVRSEMGLDARLVHQNNL